MYVDVIASPGFSQLRVAVEIINQESTTKIITADHHDEANAGLKTSTKDCES